MGKYKDPDYKKKWNKKNKKKMSAKHKIWYAKNKIAVAERDRERNDNLKKEVLTHYGNGKLKCRWQGCTFTDPIVLSLDHIADDGAEHRRKSGLSGTALYRSLKKKGFPAGYQTLCMNHQFVKAAVAREMAFWHSQMKHSHFNDLRLASHKRNTK